jgi:Zn-dependent peptidase ImmA (M78 family)
MEFLNDNKKDKLNNFVVFVKKELGISKLPKIKILNHRNGLKTTANYDYINEIKTIKVCGKNRALVDIMRSIAHELVHHKQFEDGRLEVKPPDIGGEIEDEANALSGRFIKMFSKQDETIYDE